MKKHIVVKNIALLCAAGTLLVGCGGGDDSASTNATGVTLTNCGQEVNFNKADSLFVNDGNIISMALSVGAQEKVDYVSSLQRDLDILRAKYGDQVDSLNEVAKEYPSLEEVVSKQPDVYVSGWGYGLDEAKNLTPETLNEQGIGTYLITETCRQEGSDKRGVVDPWEAVETDLKNLGALTGNEATAREVVADQQQRLTALRTAPKPEHTPTVFVFDSASETIFTSGKFGAPQAIIDAAGGRNAADNVEDTWTQVGWEHLGATAPEVIVFVEYPGQEFEEKVELLKNHPIAKDLPAVKENRFINLPYAMWTSGPLNIDAAEHVRKGMEHFGLAPQSEIQPALQLPANVPGLEYFQG